MWKRVWQRLAWHVTLRDYGQPGVDYGKSIRATSKNLNVRLVSGTLLVVALQKHAEHFDLLREKKLL